MVSERQHTSSKTSSTSSWPSWRRLRLNNVNANNNSRPVVLLSILVVQNTSAAIVGRSIRARIADDLFDIGHFLLVCESSKLVLSFVLEYFHQQRQQRKPQKQKQEQCSWLVRVMEAVVVHMYNDGLKMVVPAGLYFGSNSLRYVSQGYLKVPIFQAVIQSRLITTALCSVLFLRRSYDLKQWTCLFSTTVGMILVVMGETTVQQRRQLSVVSHENDDNGSINELFAGILLLGIAVALSSLSSVYLEWVLKDNNIKGEAAKKKLTEDALPQIEEDKDSQERQSSRQEKQKKEEEASLWIRNIQLAFFSILIAMAQIHHQGPQQTYNKKPFLHGFTPLVWLQVVLFSFGGMLVAAVTKHADSVLKVLATVISMLLSSLLSASIFSSSSPPIQGPFSFVIGSTVILLTVCTYSPIPPPNVWYKPNNVSSTTPHSVYDNIDDGILLRPSWDSPE